MNERLTIIPPGARRTRHRALAATAAAVVALFIAAGTTGACAGGDASAPDDASTVAVMSDDASAGFTGVNSRRGIPEEASEPTPTEAPTAPVVEAPEPAAPVVEAPEPTAPVVEAATPVVETAAAVVEAAPVPDAPLADTGAVVAAPSDSAYPMHTNVVATSFWVGEIFNANLSDGSQTCSTYDSQWALAHTGNTEGTTPSSASGCAGSVFGGCDGVTAGSAGSFTCATETRTAANGFFPSNQPKPLQNPFYLDLPFDDVNDATAFAQRCDVIPWAAGVNAATGADHCADSSFSYMKNTWVELAGPNGSTCYGQIQDAGPSSGSLYHDADYVFGSADARPVNTQFSGDPSQGAGTDVSPALNGCLGFAALDGDNDHVNWRFVDRANVPAGPWLTVETTAQVTQ